MVDLIWRKHYHAGVPAEIKLEAYTSLVDLAAKSFQSYRDLPAFTCMGKTLSYAELDRYARDLAAYFTGTLKLGKGERVAIMMPNILQYPIVLHAVLRAGLTVVNVNPLYTARELEHQLRDSGAKAIVIVDNFAHVLTQVLGKTPVKQVILTRLGDMLGRPKSWLVNFVVKNVKKMVPPYQLPGAISLFDALSQGAREEFKEPRIGFGDLAFLQYTGGTTGISKGAMLTHGNMVANIEQAYAWLAGHVETGKEIIITALPLYHIFSLTANCLTFMKIGGHNILITNPRDIPGFIKELKKHRFTAFTGVNTLFNALLNHPDFASVDCSTLKLSLGGGMAVQKAVADRWTSVTKSPLVQAYGLTETSPAVCINPLDQLEFNGTIGLPISSTLVSIRDEGEKEVALGQAGELCVKGPQVMKGYWQLPDETTASFTKDGYFKTGDIAVISPKGFITIVDRKKDMILVSGFNVYPNEVEEVVASHAGVLEAAAIGVDDERTGEAVKLFAVRKDPALTCEELMAHCRKHLTAYKVPKYIEFRNELPKTNVGKILRRALREAPPIA